MKNKIEFHSILHNEHLLTQILRRTDKDCLLLNMKVKIQF